MEFIHPFPMIRAGGLFLMVAGAIFALGWIWPKLFGVFLSFGFAAAGMAAWAAYQFDPPLGAVPMGHIGLLAACIVAESIAIVWTYRVVKDERRADAWMLIIVGLHFLPMAPILGPLALGLGAACAINGAVALSAARAAPILPFGLIDSAIKISFGAAMFYLYPTWAAWMRLSF